MATQTARLLLTAGEPAGIGPDLCIQMAHRPQPHAWAVVGDRQLFTERAVHLGLPLKLIDADSQAGPERHRPGELWVHHLPLSNHVIPGKLDPANAPYVLQTLDWAVNACLDGRYQAMVTGPLHKGVINDAGIPFSGHTEYLAERTATPRPVMMLQTTGLRVALATTHLPLRAVADAITSESLHEVLGILQQDLARYLAKPHPRILVCGLNPHAGESGHLGREEIDVINPVITECQAAGWDVQGPLPADTVFVPKYLEHCDVVLAMYHDQGLPVLKHMGFGRAVNVTLGLPIIRTSVDHGTALELAGTGKAQVGSFEMAMQVAQQMLEASA